MDLSAKLLQALTAQYNKERFNQATYEALRGECAALNLIGFERWMHKEAKDEQHHAHKLFRYIVTRDAKPVPAPLPAPSVPDGSATDVLPLFQAALKLEQDNEKALYELGDLADQEDDKGVIDLVEGFVKHEEKEIRELQEIVKLLERVDGDEAAILALDKRAKSGKFGKLGRK